MSEWDPSIAALIAKWREHANVAGHLALQLARTNFIPGDSARIVAETTYKEVSNCADELESAASALASHVWDRKATVPYLGQMLPRDIDVARTFNESSDPRAMLAFIKLLAVGRAQPPSGDASAMAPEKTP